MIKRRIVFVTPWYGPEIPGGAESEARNTAEKLAARGHDVRVFTTCIRDFYADWGKNHHRAGQKIENGVTVQRFKVKKRDKAAFDAVNAQLMAGRLVSEPEQRTYIEQMIVCPDLPKALAQEPSHTIFILIPYMFATTVWAAQIRPKKTLIIPCFHDEVYARMGIYRAVFASVWGMVLHTHTEVQLAQDFVGDAPTQIREVLGEGVDCNITADASRFRDKYAIHHPFMLYAGRREPGKNTPLLLDYWRRYVQQTKTDYWLLLTGSGDLGNLPPQTRDLGFVPRQDMLDAMAAATVFCLPSINESFSLVTMESWLCQTPALVHGDCAVMVEHCTRSNGGLYFTNFDEFAATLDYLQRHPTTAAKMGRLGRNYVLDNFQWDTIIDRYEALIGRIANEQ